ncbi:MAG: energy-coupling factor ABC transporter permease [Fibromonadaceae bacterium]|nr:energy-coupling factor ABC transporter permease [Fibromonadaceae bacterium]
MHMSDSLLSPAVGAAMCAVSLAANVYAVKKIKQDGICTEKVPLIGAMSAFVFATQMLNFTIPSTGSSGHIIGGILLAAIIGNFPALLSISAVLAVQCLFFADGGLLALGCNIFNMGVIPCLLIYPLIFKPLAKNGITLASIASAVASLQIGAFCVVLETQLSGIAALPFSTFLSLMQPIHFAIGIAEGIITAGILCFAHHYHRRPAITFAALAIFAGCILSPFASQYPDGLEWSIEKTMEKNFN